MLSQEQMAKIFYHYEPGFILEFQGWFKIYKTINVIHQVYRLQHRIHTIIPLDAEMALDKIQHLFMIKVTERTGVVVPQNNEGNLHEFHSQHYRKWRKSQPISLK